MSSAQPAQHKSPLVPSLFKTIRSGYSLGMLSKDISAGITVGVVALPLALAFAIASGLTPERGLYTSIVAGFFLLNVLFAHFEFKLHCRQLQPRIIIAKFMQGLDGSLTPCLHTGQGIFYGLDLSQNPLVFF